MNIKNVIISVGTNDVLRSNGNVNRFYIPIQNLLRKAKLLFECQVYFQSVIPIPSKQSSTAKSVYEFNDLVIRACKSERCYFIDVFNEFLYCRSFDKFFDVKRGVCDIHPNRTGLSILARAFIKIVRNHFDPRL